MQAMVTPCRHAKTCPMRLAWGDIDGGCVERHKTECYVVPILDTRYPMIHIERLEENEMQGYPR